MYIHTSFSAAMRANAHAPASMPQKQQKYVAQQATERCIASPPPISRHGTQPGRACATIFQPSANRSSGHFPCTSAPTRHRPPLLTRCRPAALGPIPPRKAESTALGSRAGRAWERERKPPDSLGPKALACTPKCQHAIRILIAFLPLWPRGCYVFSSKSFAC